MHIGLLLPPTQPATQGTPAGGSGNPTERVRKMQRASIDRGTLRHAADQQEGPDTDGQTCAAHLASAWGLLHQVVLPDGLLCWHTTACPCWHRCAAPARAQSVAAAAVEKHH